MMGVLSSLNRESNPGTFDLLYIDRLTNFATLPKLLFYFICKIFSKNIQLKKKKGRNMKATQ